MNETTTDETRAALAGSDEVALLGGILLELLAQYRAPQATYYLRNMARAKAEGVKTHEVRRALLDMEKNGQVQRVPNPYPYGSSRANLWWRLPPNEKY